MLVVDDLSIDRLDPETIRQPDSPVQIQRPPNTHHTNNNTSIRTHTRHYLPLLARYIVEKNTVAPPEEKLNLKGFLVGNPSTVRFVPFRVGMWW